MGLVKGVSPRVIWLRPGKTNTKILRNNFDLIKSFLTDPGYSEIGCLEINS